MNERQFVEMADLLQSSLDRQQAELDELATKEEDAANSSQSGGGGPFRSRNSGQSQRKPPGVVTGHVGVDLWILGTKGVWLGAKYVFNRIQNRNRPAPTPNCNQDPACGACKLCCMIEYMKIEEAVLKRSGGTNP